MKKQYLYDVAFIRLMLIFILVIYHALCLHTGGWEPPFDNFHVIPFYDWFGILFSTWRLSAMTFISGLLLGYQAIKKNDALSFASCIVKKMKRLLLPCLIFSVIYYLIFFDLNAPVGQIILKLINGCGHLWFLPMIFWCFAITYFINKFTPPVGLLSY